MEYRLKANELMDVLTAWDKVLPGRGKIRLVACGGTALTLLGYKESTKDVDFIVPDPKEYQRLIQFLKQAGYKPNTQYGWKRPDENVIFDLYKGNRVYSTELLKSPLEKGGCKTFRKWSKVHLCILNSMDLIVSKMFRGDEVDIQDSLILLQNEKINLDKLKRRYQETAQYEVSEEKVLRNFERLLKRINP